MILLLGSEWSEASLLAGEVLGRKVWLLLLGTGAILLIKSLSKSSGQNGGVYHR